MSAPAVQSTGDAQENAGRLLMAACQFMSANCKVAFGIVFPIIHGLVMPPCSLLRSWSIALTAALPLTASAWADSVDHDALRRAVQSGEIRPLADIFAALRGKLPGQIIGTEVERKHGRWIYEFRVTDDKGRLFEVYVDAGTGEIERTKEK